jgi:hypothetical protein
MTAANDLAIRRALEVTSVEFIEEKRWWSQGYASKGHSAKINQMTPAWAALESTSGLKFGRQKFANCRRRNEVFSSITFRHMRCELSTHDADKAFTIGIENSRS